MLIPHPGEMLGRFSKNEGIVYGLLYAANSTYIYVHIHTYIHTLNVLNLGLSKFKLPPIII